MDGVVVGCDRNQEWLLPWWWEHYRRENAFPVLFVDFAMSEKGAAFCEKRGERVLLPPPSFALQPVDGKWKQKWTARYGNGIWAKRPLWFLKPYAFLLSPFSRSLWLDLDCQVLGRLDPLFHCLTFGAEIALAPEPEAVQREHAEAGFLLPGEINYNSGVVPFVPKSPILKRWVEEVEERNCDHISDQQALSRAVFHAKPPLFTLPPECNWPADEPNEKALIRHFLGGALKAQIAQSLLSSANP